MKNILTKICAFGSISLLVLSACNKNSELVKSNGGKAGTLSTTASMLVLNKAQVNNDTTNAIAFSFTAANYGYASSVTNTLQIDVPGDNWANPTSYTLTSRVYSQGFSTPAFNSLLLKLNLPAGQASQVSVRVMSSISTYQAPIYTNVLNLTVTPFNLTSWVYVPGAYEGSSWPNPGPLEDSLESLTGNGIYTGIINFPSGGSQFLITPAKNWSNKYATNGGVQTTTSVNYAVTYNGSNNFQAPPAGGYYLLTLNTNTNTLTIVPADYYSVIGDAAMGWNTGDDVPMKFINDGTNTWLASNVAMSVELPPNDGFKIRQDDAWNFSWGTGSTAGILTTSNGTNIGISVAGNYNVTFSMAPTPFGTPPATTGAYTVTKQ